MTRGKVKRESILIISYLVEFAVIGTIILYYFSEYNLLSVFICFYHKNQFICGGEINFVTWTLNLEASKGI